MVLMKVSCVENNAIKAAIFDMDGLLINSEQIIMDACIAAAKDIGIHYTPAEFVELIGRSGADASRIMCEQLGGEDNMAAVSRGLNARLVTINHVFPLKKGAKALLDYYQAQGIKLAVASSSPIQHITHRLQHVGVLDYFNVITSGQEVEKGKPNPDIYLLAMSRLKVPATACIAFEDSEPGARAAIAADLNVVVVPDLKQPSEFVRSNAFVVVECLQTFLKHSRNGSLNQANLV